MKVVFAKVGDAETAENFVKEKIFPIYKEAEGLRAAGFMVVDGEAISWNFWDSEESSSTVYGNNLCGKELYRHYKRNGIITKSK